MQSDASSNSLCSFRRWPTFRQSGASKWSSHTLNGRITQPTLGTRCGSGASHLRNAARSHELVPRPNLLQNSLLRILAEEARGEKYPGKLQIRCSSLQRQESVLLFLAVCRHGNPCSRKNYFDATIISLIGQKRYLNLTTEKLHYIPLLIKRLFFYN